MVHKSVPSFRFTMRLPLFMFLMVHKSVPSFRFTMRLPLFMFLMAHKSVPSFRFTMKEHFYCFFMVLLYNHVWITTMIELFFHHFMVQLKNLLYILTMISPPILVPHGNTRESSCFPYHEKALTPNSHGNLAPTQNMCTMRKPRLPYIMVTCRHTFKILPYSKYIFPVVPIFLNLQENQHPNWAKIKWN